MDLNTVNKAPVSRSPVNTSPNKPVDTQNITIDRKAHRHQVLPKSERRKEDRRRASQDVILDVRSGNGRRADDNNGSDHININI